MAEAPPRPSPVDRLTGIVTAIYEIEMEKSDPDVHVIATRTADMRAYGTPHKMGGNGSGAGLTREAAHGAAVGEAMERYACNVLHPEDLLYGTSSELDREGETSISPTRWALFDARQTGVAPYVPFSAEVPIAWVKADNLTQRRDCWVPACMVYLPYIPQFVQRGEQLVGSAISTGTACANTRAESLFKGICEVLERDAFMIAWRNRLPVPKLEIDRSSSLFELFQKSFVRPGLEYTLFLTSMDLGMPSVFGMLRDLRKSPPAIVVGGAAHPDPTVAALKTLLELVQGLKWMDYSVTREFPVEEHFANIRSFEDRMHLYSLNDMTKAFQFLLEQPSRALLSEVSSRDRGNPAENLHYWISELGRHELEVLAIDLTTADIEDCGYFVTKVLIPECEVMEGDHQRPFLGGRRWRDVPARLGLHADPVNPYPHPYP